VRSTEDVYHQKQSIAKYAIEVYIPTGGGHEWRDITSRGRTVSLGTIDMTKVTTGATSLRWTCLQGEMGGIGTLAGVELYLAKPP
jgi:hypothetical protein